MLKILLIDDNLLEKKILSYHLQQASYGDFYIEQVSKCSDGVKRLLAERYDIVLLDNALEDSISAEFSVPFIQEHLHGAPLVIISNNIYLKHLLEPDILGVDYIVDKNNLSKFMLRILPIFKSENLPSKYAS